MSIALTTNQAFDDYAFKCGWVYDNGGWFQGEHWEWFVRSETGVVLLRQPPDRVALVQIEKRTVSEFWSGRIATSTDFD